MVMHTNIKVNTKTGMGTKTGIDTNKETQTMPLLSKILLKAKLIDPKTLAQAQQHAKQYQQDLLVVLIDQHMLSADVICNACANHYQLATIDINTLSQQPLPLTNIHPNWWKQYVMLPIDLKEKLLTVAVSNPCSLNQLEALQFRTGFSIQAVFANYTQLTNKINNVLNQQQLTHTTPIITIVEQILNDAILKRASDIHLEPQAEQLRVRLRIDGLLYCVATLSADQANAIISRFKIMAKVDIAEKRLPQDGRFHYNNKQGQSRDCRLATCPTLTGEKVVVRLLDSQQQLLSLNELGLNHSLQQQLLQALLQPQGLILVTGPTGSGKTQTLYTALQQLNHQQRNIITIEDPVEIQLPGINQVHVNDKAGLDFAYALRAFLRQDPDVIMVGEIRDLETAETAIRAAQTGHLVLSTLHTNSAIATITRLINLGIPRHQLASTLTLIIAQRLARTLCSHCKQKYCTDLTTWQSYLSQPQITEKPQQLDAPKEYPKQIFKAQGCQHCLSGYKGRCGVFEVMPINQNLQHAIATQSTDATLLQQAQQAGMHLLWQAALDKVSTGLTSINEIYRVIQHASI